MTEQRPKKVIAALTICIRSLTFQPARARPPKAMLVQCAAARQGARVSSGNLTICGAKEHRFCGPPPCTLNTPMRHGTVAQASQSLRLAIRGLRIIVSAVAVPRLFSRERGAPHWALKKPEEREARALTPGQGRAYASVTSLFQPWRACGKRIREIPEDTIYGRDA